MTPPVRSFAIEPAAFVSGPLVFAEEAAANTAKPRTRTAAQWGELLETGQLPPDEVRSLVSDLSAAGQHDEVITLIEQALIHGGSQPWMYEVLALSMELAGRPKAQIERVLLSSRDVTPPTVESLLFLAAYLARFERYPQALKTCRQAAELAPNRPEPYVEMLRLAERAKDHDEQAWAAVGVLTTAWGPRQLAWRDQAADAITRVRAAWKAAEKWMRLMELEAAVAQAERVDLRVRLEWSGAGDLDLEVIEPRDGVCHRDQPYSTGGGIFLHDGAGPAAATCYDEYVCPIGWSGEYRLRVRHRWGTIVGKRATLIITRGMEPPERVGVAISQETAEVRITLKGGRRQAPTVPPPQSRRSSERGPVQQTVLAQLQPAGQVLPANFGGGFGGAVGYQPVVQVINEGVSLSALAVVSGDRRYVRLTLQPVFSNITDVFTFSFAR